MSPLRRHDSRIVWEGPSWRLRVDELTLPDDSSVERGTIEHPGSVVLVPVVDSPENVEVLILSQYRLALDETILELPAGTRGWEEAWLTCAQRELREETGYRAKRFMLLSEIWPAPGLSNEVMRIYLASDLVSDPLPADADEEIAVHSLPLSDLVAMVHDGRLKDGKSVAGILRASEILDQ